MLANAATYNDIWQSCLTAIKTKTSSEEFAKWFLPIEPLEFDGKHLQIKVPSRDFARIIEDNYSQVLNLLLQSCLAMTPVCSTLFQRAIDKLPCRVRVIPPLLSTPSRHKPILQIYKIL